MSALLGAGGLAQAVSGPPDFVVIFPADTACAGFDLQVEGWLGKQHFREFSDKNGVVRTISAGTGSALRYTNLQSGGMFSSRSNGSVTRTTYNVDGSTTLELMGHNVVFLFPTDTPPGPSTTLYAGRVVILVDLDGNFTVQQASGNATDICAAVSP
jgi:hypothetical protein